MSTYRYEYQGEIGLTLWSCTREGAGICGYGATQKDALQDFRDKEDELVPTHEEIETEAAIDDHLHEEAFGERG